MKEADEDASVGAMILTGSERVFTAGVGIKEMKDKSFTEAYTTNFLAHWVSLSLRSQSLQLSAAAPHKSTLESSLATAGPNVSHVPLVNCVPSMELVLTGRIIDADEAERWGIVRVVREGSVVEEAVKVVNDIASKGRIAVGAAVNAAFEMSLAEGLRFEKRLFHALFSTKDQKEGMAAFTEKCRAKQTHSRILMTSFMRIPLTLPVVPTN
ncbi:ClpP/crotonase [Suillus lakei]|nr:ClpP/crotonase [Suillus lakei]